MTRLASAADRLRASARARVLLVLVLVLAFAALVTIGLLRQVLQATAGERVDAALQQEVEEFRRLVERGRDPRTGRPFGRDVERMFDVFLANNVPGQGEAVYTFLPSGPHRSTIEAPPPPVVADRVAELGREGSRTDRGRLEVGGLEVRFAAVPVVVGGVARGTFVVTGDLRQAEADAAEATRVAAYASGAALILATLLGLAAVGATLRPLRDMSATAQAITDTDLTRRIPVRGGDEIAELGATFNQMLDRLEVAFDSQRALVSDAGHELRTPITIVRGHLELLGDDPVERAETMALVRDELDRMSRLVDDLLTLAKSERTDFLRLEVLDLDVLTEELFAKARALAPRDWRLGAVGAGELTADRQRLTQAVVNLADNAVRYAPADATIELSSSHDGAVATLTVRDTGPGVAPAEQERVFERFARGASAPRGEGAGLGLAIVSAVARAHDGRVTLDSAPGRGAAFTIHLPTDLDPDRT